VGGQGNSGGEREPGTSAATQGAGTEAASGAAAAEAAPSTLIEQAGQLRFTSVESLRAVGALGVVMTHVWGATEGEFYESFTHRLASGVGFGALFFFALTGCLLYLPFAKRDFGGGREIGLRQYGINRALRIFPLYYACLVIVVLFVKEDVSFEVALRWALFLENFYPEGILDVNGVFWTVVIELHFYLLLPLIAWGIARLARSSIRRAALVLIGLGTASYLIHLKYVVLPDQSNRDVYFSLPAWFFLVAAGMLVSLLVVHWREHGPPSWVRGPLASSDVWIFSAVPLWFLVIVDYDFDLLLAPASFLVLAGCLLPLEGRRVAIRILEWRWIAVLGLSAYSIYVWHVPLIDVLTADLTNSLTDSYFLLLAITMPLICVVSLISYRLVEEPALRLRRRWLGPAGPRRPEPPAQPREVEPASSAPAPTSGR
jgi:peptidoglycan/LPS O-acetylase OafA/YrhL